MAYSSGRGALKWITTSTRTGPTIVAGSIELIAGFATRVKERRLEREIGTAAGTVRLTEKLLSKRAPNSIALTCEHAQFVIRRRLRGEILVWHWQARGIDDRPVEIRSAHLRRNR